MSFADAKWSSAILARRTLPGQAARRMFRMPSCSPHVQFVCKVLAVALCLAPARYGAAGCRCDCKDVKKEKKAGNGRYNLRVASAPKLDCVLFLEGVFWD